jgi:hypothetical protein
MALFGKKKGEALRDFEPEKGEVKGGYEPRDIITGQVLNHEYVRKNRRYLLFLVFLAFLYINNHYGVEALLKKHLVLTKEVKDLKYEAITTSSQLMHISKQSEVVRRAQEAGLGLEVLTIPPRVLE